jgi:hypothetical protein
MQPALAREGPPPILAEANRFPAWAHEMVENVLKNWGLQGKISIICFPCRFLVGCSMAPIIFPHQRTLEANSAL